MHGKTKPKNGLFKHEKDRKKEDSINKDVKNLFRIKTETAKEKKQNTPELEMYEIFFGQENKQPKK